MLPFWPMITCRSQPLSIGDPYNYCHATLRLCKILQIDISLPSCWPTISLSHGEVGDSDYMQQLI